MRYRVKLAWVTLTPDLIFAFYVGKVAYLSVIDTPEGMKALIATQIRPIR